MNDVKMSNCVEFLKQKEQQVSSDNYVVGKNIGGVSFNAATNKHKVEYSIMTPEKAMYTRSQQLKIDILDGDEDVGSFNEIEVESVHSDEDEGEGIFDISDDINDEADDEDDGGVYEVDCFVNCCRHQITSSKHDVVM